MAGRLRSEGVDRRRRGKDRRAREESGELRTDLATGPSPVDRSKLGTKRSIITDGQGIPLGLILAAANENDNTLAEDTLDSLLADRPQPTTDKPQNFCADKGYDDKAVRQAGEDRKYIVHIRHRGQTDEIKPGETKHPARRWVIERTNSWHNRYRKLKIRYEKYAENYVGLVEFACCLIVYRQMLN